MKYQCTNAYYFRELNQIGGIESHLYYIGRKYGLYDITVFYYSADINQLMRISRNIRCIKLTQSDTVECDKLFCCFNREILDQCKWKKSHLVLHGDYLSMVKCGQLSKENLPLDDRIDEYLGVSQLVCDSWYELTGIKAINVYEPVVLDEVEKPLMFISATRLTKEKGWNRMKYLAEILDQNKVNYIWIIFTDSPHSPTPNMVFMKPRLDITDKLGMFDAFIQLSDNEGFCLSIIEALMRGVPVIATDLPVLKELGVNKNNSIILNHDMKDIPIKGIKEIYKKHFTYKPPEDRWEKVIKRKESQYSRKKTMIIRARKDYFDVELKKDIKKGEEYEVKRERGEYIIFHGYAEMVEDDKIVEEKPKRGRKKKNAVSEAVD